MDSTNEKKDYLYMDFPPLSEITKSVREENKKRLFTGGYRVNNAMYRTKKEDKKYREKSLKRKMP